MFEFRKHLHDVQVIEGLAAEKAGMRFRVMDELKLMGPQGAAYIDKFLMRMIADITPELLEVVKIGKQFGDSIVASKK